MKACQYSWLFAEKQSSNHWQNTARKRQENHSLQCDKKRVGFTMAILTRRTARYWSKLRNGSWMLESHHSWVHCVSWLKVRGWHVALMARNTMSWQSSARSSGCNGYSQTINESRNLESLSNAYTVSSSRLFEARDAIHHFRSVNVIVC